MKKVWRALFLKFVRYSPETWGGVRAFFVRRYIKKAGRNLSIGRKAYIAAETQIGDYSGIGYNCIINAEVTIGSNVMMGPNVTIYTSNHCTKDTTIPMRLQGMTQRKPVIIEDDVWIGGQVCILPGVRIGTGSVIGACAVVSKDVPSYAVVVGNPARVVKFRNKD